MKFARGGEHSLTSEEKAYAEAHMRNIMTNCRVAPGTKCKRSDCLRCADASRQRAFKSSLYLNNVESLDGCVVRLCGAVTSKVIGKWMCLVCDKLSNGPQREEKSSGLKNVWQHLMSAMHFHMMRVKKGEVPAGTAATISVDAHRDWKISIGEAKTKAERQTELHANENKKASKRGRSPDNESATSPGSLQYSGASLKSIPADSPFAQFTTTSKAPTDYYSGKRHEGSA
jgi:hypothetical protein